MISVDVHNQAGPALGNLATSLPAGADEVLAAAGAQALTLIRQNASTGFHAPGEPHIEGTGPGPNVATGDYRRSWAMKVLPGEVLVFTNSPQAARLEYGFVGADSMGRWVHASPYPHVRPALEEIQPQLVAAMRRLIAGSVT